MKFGLGDKVKIVNYGHLMWSNDIRFGFVGEKDISTELVGQIGMVEKAHLTQKKPSYFLKGIKGKLAWYDEEQLEMVSQNQNNIE